MKRAPVPVIFRVWKDGAVIALFPTLPASSTDPDLCSSYMHVGQHGAASPQHVVNATRRARPEEYAELKRELESLQYRLRVTDRLTQQLTQERRTNFRPMMESL